MFRWEHLISLRVLSECLILVRSVMFDATFNLVTHAPIFSAYRKVFQNGVKTVSEISSNKPGFQFCSNYTSMWFKHISNNVGRYFRLPTLAFATMAWKSFNFKFIAKNHFPIGHFLLQLLMLT